MDLAQTYTVSVPTVKSIFTAFSHKMHYTITPILQKEVTPTPDTPTTYSHPRYTHSIHTYPGHIHPRHTTAYTPTPDTPTTYTFQTHLPWTHPSIHTYPGHTQAYTPTPTHPSLYTHPDTPTALSSVPVRNTHGCFWESPVFGPIPMAQFNCCCAQGATW